VPRDSCDGPVVIGDESSSARLVPHLDAEVGETLDE